MVIPAARRAAVVSVAVALIGAVSGCAADRVDSSVPAATAGSANEGSATAGTSSRAVALAALQPCDLLDRELGDRLGYLTREAFVIAHTRACTHTTADGTATLTISLVTGSGIRGLQPPPTDTTTSHVVGVHKAIRIQAAEASRCTLVLDVEDRDSVSVQAVLGAGQDSCALVMEVATAVEPLLP